jgi:hypothetical protein
MPEGRRLFRTWRRNFAPPGTYCRALSQGILKGDGTRTHGTKTRLPALSNTNQAQKVEVIMGRGILLWLIGIPIPIIILILLFWR